jgi:hypothetical protein
LAEREPSIINIGNVSENADDKNSLENLFESKTNSLQGSGDKKQLEFI